MGKDLKGVCRGMFQGTSWAVMALEYGFITLVLLQPAQ